MAPSPVELADSEGPSPPTTTPPPSTYRELDNAFLQSQTRIWLGEVLNMRFDKDMNISDLLADGQILFEVYKEFRRMLISGDNLSQQKFLGKESVSSSEITEIFPYAKVERFLEVCQGLGVPDIDLFTTSDVVDKRNTWKVCICLRSLSKKARSKNLNIPEFDSVTVTHRKKSPVNMPTDMVGNRRRNLERASSSPVLSSDDMRKVSKRSQQGEFVGFHADSNAYKSDDGDDDCESDTYTANSVSPKTPDISEVGDFSSVQSELEQLKIEDLDEDEIDETSSPSQALRSGVDDNFQLVDHHANQDHSPIHVDWQALEEESGVKDAAKFDDTTVDNENESDEDDCCSYIKLPQGTEPDQDVHNLSNKAELVSENEVEAIGAETMPHTDLNYEECRDIKCIEDMEKPLNSCSENCEAVPDAGLENCDDANSECHFGKIDLPVIEDSEKVNSHDIEKPFNYGSGNSEVVQNGGLENCDEASSECHLVKTDIHAIKDSEFSDKSQVGKDEIEDLKDEAKNIALKPPRKMLKLIAGGTGTVAAVGVMLYFLQLRRPPKFYTFLTKAPLSIFFLKTMPEFLGSHKTTP